MIDRARRQNDHLHDCQSTRRREWKVSTSKGVNAKMVGWWSVMLFCTVDDVGVSKQQPSRDIWHRIKDKWEHRKK